NSFTGQSWYSKHIDTYLGEQDQMAGRKRKTHEERPDPASAKKARKRSRLGYDFDPIPKCTLELIRNKRLKPQTIVVLQVMLRYRKKKTNSGWTTTDRLALETGFSEATVNRYLTQLKTVRLIERRKLLGPDPIDPKNRTGYRFYFLFIR